VTNLLEEYIPRVYRFALRLCGNSAAAEDLTQETFLRAWKARLRLRDPKALRVWLFRITANLWRDQLRRHQSRVARAGPLPAEQPDSTPAPERQAAGRDELRRALVAMDDLPPRQREVLYLSACDGLSVSEIADILEISSDSVKASLSLARKSIRQRLSDLFQELFPALDKDQ
jgi:RNA polymerase sigma-70 factor (ECF subfamily)